MSQNNIAPILVTVYNRYEHFVRCVNHLKKNALAEKSVLFISSDAASNRNDIDAVERIRSYARGITGFADVVYLFWENNQGLLRSYHNSVQKMLESFESFIFLEDDILVSPDFLSYMNECLLYYENDPRVFSVSGFSLSMFYPNLIDNESDVYFTHRFNPWGVGIWKNRLLNGSEYSFADLKESLKEEEFVEKLNRVGFDLYPAFLSFVAQKKMIELDYLNLFHMIKNDLVTVTPYVSKTFNIGNDGSGSRTKMNKKYMEAELSFLEKSQNYVLTRNIESNVNDTINEKGHEFRSNKIKILLYRVGLLSLVMKIKRTLKKIKN